MKKFLYLLFAACAVLGCSNEDLILEKLESLENRVTQLEELCKEMNVNVASLQAIVNALQEKDYVTSVKEIVEGVDTIGYTIYFSKSNPTTIYHGTDGWNPSIGIQMDSDSLYYWNVDGEWLVDDKGEKILAQGIEGEKGVTPQLKIENNLWYVTYDGGVSWVELNQVFGDEGYPFFLNVEEDDRSVHFTLNNGVVLTLPKGSDGAILDMKFLAKHNPLNLAVDIECAISDAAKIHGHIPNIVSSKKMIPTFNFVGQKVLVDTINVVSGETVLDFSKPVTMSVVGKNGIVKEYIVEVMAFTGLPVVYINTEEDKAITSKEEYLNATIRIVEDVHTRAAGDVFESDVRIKGRGNSTWSLPKKPYKLKFDKKQSLLGEPKDKEWVLLANYTDKTAIRNELAFFMSRMSQLEYTNRTHFVDLVLNNVYVGTYQLGEQLKISEDRVNVGDDGYLLEVDAKAAADDITFKTPHIGEPINIKEPDVEVGSEAYDYVVKYLNGVDSVLFSDNFTDSLNGYAKYLDVSSFVEWYLINEIAKNNDACFYSSCYMNLSRGGKLKMGPIWDFDIAFGNVNYLGNNNPDGFWVKKRVSWYSRLFMDENFVAKVKERFNYFYENKNILFNEINENANYLKYSVVENNAVWNTLYEYTWPNYAIWGSYDNEVAYLKQWLNTRMEWLKAEFDAM